jgi:hypothetical protein
MKSDIRTAEEKAQLLREFEEDLPLYVAVRKPTSRRWHSSQLVVRQSLDALQVFNMTQPLPVALAGLRTYEIHRSVKIRHLRELLLGIESFHLQFTAVAGRSSSGGVSARYASHARQFRSGDPERNQRNIYELLDKLRESLPTEDEFDAGFRALGYSSTSTGEKSLVKYILSRMYRHHAGGGLHVDFDLMTIEHLAPEHPTADDLDVSSDAIRSIGNLILVSEDLNNLLSNKSFGEKQEILRDQSDLWVDPVVLEAECWDEEAIRARSQAMAAVARTQVWRIPS